MVRRGAKDYLIEYENLNDAPAFAQNISAFVDETPNAIGVDDAQDSDNLSGTIIFNDIDPSDTLESLTVSLVGAGSARSDGKFVLSGNYGELVFDPSNFTYEYTPDVNKIEPVYAQTVTDDFTFKVFDDEGASDSLTLSVKVTGAEDKPRIAEEQSFITLGSGEKDTVVGSVNVDDGSQYAGFELAPPSSSNDNDKFIKTDSGELKYNAATATNFSEQNKYR